MLVEFETATEIDAAVSEFRVGAAAHQLSTRRSSIVCSNCARCLKHEAERRSQQSPHAPSIMADVAKEPQSGLKAANLGYDRLRASTHEHKIDGDSQNKKRRKASPNFASQLLKFVACHHDEKKKPSDKLRSIAAALVVHRAVRELRRRVADRRARPPKCCKRGGSDGCLFAVAECRRQPFVVVVERKRVVGSGRVHRSRRRPLARSQLAR